MSIVEYFQIITPPLSENRSGVITLENIRIQFGSIYSLASFNLKGSFQAGGSGKFQGALVGLAAAYGKHTLPGGNAPAAVLCHHQHAPRADGEFHLLFLARLQMDTSKTAEAADGLIFQTFPGNIGFHNLIALNSACVFYVHRYCQVFPGLHKQRRDIFADYHKPA